jgi:MFS family permease
LPEIIDAVALKSEIVEGADDSLDEQLNDKAAGIYATFYSIGMIIGPLIGGPLYDNIGYNATCDFLALICSIYTVFYFIFNVGFSIFKNEKQLKVDLEYMKSRFYR